MQKTNIAAAVATLASSAPDLSAAYDGTARPPIVGADLAEPLSDTELEQRVEALKPTAPRITKEHIQSLIVDETYTSLEGTRTTVCRLELANGFCVVGVNNGPVSAANFDQQLGCEYAYKAAVEQIWPLEGYLLAERLFRGSVQDEKVGQLRDLVGVQRGQDPSGQDSYMRGLTNGLALALSVFTGQEPELVSAPTMGHQERVRAERDDLDGKIERLAAFVNGSVFETLPENERARLSRQLGLMKDYSSVLSDRIADFPA